MEILEDRRVLATFMVTTTADAGAGSLRQAVLDANALAGADDIVFDATVAGMTFSLTSGELAVTDSLDIFGDGSTVDAGGLSRVFNVDSAGAGIAVEIRNLTIQAGSQAGGNGGNIRNVEELFLADSTVTGGAADFGGGVFNDGGILILGTTTVSTNSAVFSGGGIYNFNGGQVVIDGSTIDANTTANALDFSAIGGGISNDGLGSDVTITNSYITNNVASHDDTTYAQQGLGAGIANDYYSTLSITDTVISGNTADLGAGMWTDDGVTNTLLRVNVYENYALVDGAGVYMRDFSITNITDSMINNNYAVDDGGGVHSSTGAVTTITNTQINGNTALDRGAGFRVTSFANRDDSAVLILNDSNVTGNSAGGIGGGLYFGTKFDATIRNTEITSNYAVDGGGFFASGFNNAYALYESFLRLYDSSVSGNSASDDGGGLAIDSVVNIVLDGTTVSDNYAYDRAGGLRVAFGDPGYYRTADIRNSTISGNSSLDVGGGLYLGNPTTTGNVSDSTFDNNESYLGGGGVFAGFISTANFDASTFSNNRATSFSGYGGGLEVANSTFALTRSTVSGNTADIGGGLRLYGSDAAYYSISIDQSTVTGNLANQTGGGIYSSYGYTPIGVNSSIVAANMVGGGGYGSDWYDYMAMVNVTYTLVGDNANFSLPEANPDANGNIVGGAIGGVVDPMLGALANNGGPTLTHLPDMLSPAVDSGDLSIVGGSDQRGYTRVANGRADMGSVEYGGMPNLDGDFNDDGYWDCMDINMLTMETAAGTNDPNFDLTGDGFVNSMDIDAWLIEGGAMNPGVTGGNPFLRGDADLNGSVDGGDFILWNGSKFTNNTDWCGGNFDGNGATDGADFIIWNGNKFMSSDLGTHAVGQGPRAGDGENGLEDRDARHDRERRPRESGSANRLVAIPAAMQVTGSEGLLDRAAAQHSSESVAIATPQLVAWQSNNAADTTSERHDRAGIEAAIDQVFRGTDSL